MYGKQSLHHAQAYCVRHGHAWEIMDTWIDIATDDYVIASQEVYCPRCEAHGTFNQRYNWERKNEDMDADRTENDP